TTLSRNLHGIKHVEGALHKKSWAVIGAVNELECGHSPPKLGGVPERKRGRGGSLNCQQRQGNHPACSDFVLAGTPPNLGGELRVINSFTAVTKAKLWCRNQATIYCAFILHFERVAHECLL